MLRCGNHRPRTSPSNSEINKIFQRPLRTAPPSCYYEQHGQRPNSYYRNSWLQHKDKTNNLHKENLAKETVEREKAHVNIEFLTKTDKSVLRNEIKERVNAKMREQEERLEIRRSKLRDMLAGEENELQKEALHYIRQKEALMLEETIRRKDDLVQMKEEENRKIVRERRIQQSLARSQELRPYIFKKNLLDSKEVQLQQIKEKESQRKYAKELDMMWDNIIDSDVYAKLISDRQGALDNYNKQQKQREDLDIQIKEKELLKQHALRTQLENQIEMEKLNDKLRKHEIEKLKEEQKKREQYEAELAHQIKMREKVLRERKKAEKAAEEALVQQSKVKCESQKTKTREIAASAKKEAAQYRRNLTDLLQQRQTEEKKFDDLLENHRKMIEKLEHDCNSKFHDARKRLHQDVIEGRRIQMELKKQEAIKEVRQKETEHELLLLSYEKNKRLDKELARRQAESAKQYRDDLQKQIEYNNSVKEKERQELQRQLELGQQEEEKLRKPAADIIAMKCVQVTKHPFHKVLKQDDCQGPSINTIF